MNCLVVRGRTWSSESNKHRGTNARGYIGNCLVIRSRHILFSKQKKLSYFRSISLTKSNLEMNAEK
jgi:hypothetical protein